MVTTKGGDMGETSLKHKILAIAEEEGAESASYALKLLQSEGKITIKVDFSSDHILIGEYRIISADRCEAICGGFDNFSHFGSNYMYFSITCIKEDLVAIRSSIYY